MSLNMKNLGMDKLLSRMFRRVDGVVWDLYSGKTGVRTEDGIATLSGSGEDATIEINMFDQFGMEVPAFAQGTPLNDVNVGDLIYFGAKDTPGWVISKDEKGNDANKTTSFKLLRTNGQTTSWRPPKVQLLGGVGGDNNVMVLRSLTNMLPGGQSDLNGMQNGLMQMVQMQMLMGGDSEGIDMDKIMPMMLMGQMTGQGGGNMMQTMMMMQMMSGGNNLLGGSKKSPFNRG